jgi:subtilisin-like proprotein convertase family protein
MKILVPMLAVSLNCTALAGNFLYSANNLNVLINDNDLTGYQNTITVSGLPQYASDINVTLNISGGFNGDLYAFLSHGSSAAILLNRTGRSSPSNTGYSDAGFGPDSLLNPFIFDDQAAHDVHFYRSFAFTLNGTGQLIGNWQPDGRAIDPLSSGASFDTAPRTGMLSIFNGMDPNGTWTLFLADVSPGGQSTLVSWGMSISAIPEPSSLALALLSVAGAAVFVFVSNRR